MRQINLRQEASRIGGISSCGRELCCSTWLTDFKTVSTSAARYQNLSLNPNKLSGQCGRLKCCLNFELDTYMDALKDIPTLKGPLITEKGNARLQKTDIFKHIMWFGYENDNSWIPITASRVKEILQMNKDGEKPATLKENAIALKSEASEVLNSDLEKLDRKFKNRSKKNRRNKNKRRGGKNRNKR
jgi:cell fate regulator YaaT (PSP1 superfamily)